MSREVPSRITDDIKFEKSRGRRTYVISRLVISLDRDRTAVDELDKVVPIVDGL